MQATTHGDAFSDLRSIVESGDWSAENFDPGLAQVFARFILFGIVLILMQGRCTIYAKHTTGLEIILDAPDGTSS
jgi:hypothetical protein